MNSACPKFRRAPSVESVQGSSIAELPDVALSGSAGAGVPSSTIVSMCGTGRLMPQHVSSAATVTSSYHHCANLPPHTSPRQSLPTTPQDGSLQGAVVPGPSLLDVWAVDTSRSCINRHPAMGGTIKAASPTARSGIAPHPAMQRAVDLHGVQEDFRHWQRQQGPHVDETIPSLNTSLSLSPGKVGGVHRAASSLFPHRDNASPLLASPTLAMSCDDDIAADGRTPISLMASARQADPQATQLESLTRVIAMNQHGADMCANVMSRLTALEKELVAAHGVMRAFIASGHRVPLSSGVAAVRRTLDITSLGPSRPSSAERDTAGHSSQPSGLLVSIQSRQSTLSAQRSALSRTAPTSPPPRKRTIALLILIVAASVVGNVILHSHRCGSNMSPLFVHVMRIVMGGAQQLLRASGRRAH
jgi:hypothetical protein